MLAGTSRGLAPQACLSPQGPPGRQRRSGKQHRPWKGGSSCAGPAGPLPSGPTFSIQQANPQARTQQFPETAEQSPGPQACRVPLGGPSAQLSSVPLCPLHVGLMPPLPVINWRVPGSSMTPHTPLNLTLPGAFQLFNKLEASHLKSRSVWTAHPATSTSPPTQSRFLRDPNWLTLHLAPTAVGLHLQPSQSSYP